MSKPIGNSMCSHLQLVIAFTANQLWCGIKSQLKVHGLSGTSGSVKVSLKCNRCNTFYGYSRFGRLQQGWNLYPNSREMVEATDVCFVDRILLQWQIFLA